MKAKAKLWCPYCGSVATLTTGRTIYPRLPKLKDKIYYVCKDCNAYVGCHPGTAKPLGRLADKELRQLKIRTHEIFDVLWKSKAMSRSSAYKDLAKEMGITLKECHIGMFSNEQCKLAMKKAQKLVNKIK